MSRPNETPMNERSGVRGFVVALAVLAVSGLTSLAGNFVIALGFPDRPYPEDLVLRAVPASTWAAYVTEVAIISSLVLIFAYAMVRARGEFADMVAIFGVMYVLRSAIMVLTPLARAYRGDNFGAIPLEQLGMFPSGHVAASLLCFLLIDRERAPGMRRAALVLLLVQSTALLVAHGHYSIDIVGGLLLGYFVWREWYSGALFDPLKRLMSDPRLTAAGEQAA